MKILLMKYLPISTLFVESMSLATSLQVTLSKLRVKLVALALKLLRDSRSLCRGKRGYTSSIESFIISDKKI